MSNSVAGKSQITCYFRFHVFKPGLSGDHFPFITIYTYKHAFISEHNMREAKNGLLLADLLESLF